MNIDELRTVQTKERQKDSLQHLRDSFYEDVADYIRDLKAERDDAAAAADDPFSDPEVSRFTDEIETAEEVVEAIYERRVGKVVKLSSFAAADMPVDEEGLTAQERDLFEDLVARIGENKGRVLDILAGEGDAGKASPAASQTADSTDATGADSAGGTERTTAGERPTVDETTEAADETTTGSAGSARSEDSPARSEPAFGAGDDPDRTAVDEASAGDRTAADDEPPTPPDTPSADEATEVLDADDAEPGAVEDDDAVQPSTPAADPEMTETSERTTVRVTADVGRFLGVDDREYDLRSDDVVDLPADNADALLQRDAAEKLG